MLEKNEEQNELNKAKFDFVERVLAWNKERGLDTQGFDKHREFGFILEELWEGTNYKNAFYNFPEVVDLEQSEKKQWFRDEVAEYTAETIRIAENQVGEATPEEQADALIDIAVFALGGLYKLSNQYPELGTVQEMLEKVCNANDAKGSKKDESGKIIKDEAFVEPVFTFNRVDINDENDSEEKVDVEI